MAEKFHTAVAAKTNSPFLLPLIFAECSFREIICVVDFRICQKKKVILPVGSHSLQKVKVVPVIFIRMRSLVFGLAKLQYGIIYAVIGLNLRIRKTGSVAFVS